MRDVVDIDIDPALLARLEALPSGGQGVPRRPWTPEEDAILLRFWPTKIHLDVAKAIGVGVGTALRRYKELTE